MTQALATHHQPKEVEPIDAADLKAWELSNRVFTWMGENRCYNYTEAFRQLDVARSSFYRAIKRPFVQGKLRPHSQGCFQGRPQSCLGRQGRQTRRFPVPSPGALR